MHRMAPDDEVVGALLVASRALVGVAARSLAVISRQRVAGWSIGRRLGDGGISLRSRRA